VSKEAKQIILSIIVVLLLVSMCDSGGSSNPYDYPEDCYQGPRGYEC